MSCLFIGGPVDGQWLEAESPLVKVPERVNPPDCIAMFKNPQDNAIDVRAYRTWTYEAMSLVFDDASFIIYKPAEWTPENVLRTLLGGYKPIK